MNIAEPFIRRPVATSLLAAALLLAGAVGYTQLPVAPLPRVDFPTIAVRAALPGASPEVMASAVATPLERRFGRIAGLTEMTSSSALGMVNITLQFDLDRDQDAAGRDVQAAINAAGSDLPANLPTRPSYQKINPADAPIMILTATSRTLPLGKVYEAANTILAQKIAQVAGVGQVFVGGGQQPAVRVQVDPMALAGVGQGLDDVRRLLSRATVNQPKGVLDGPHRAETIAATDQLGRAEEYRDLLLTYRNGAAVRLGDVASVVDGVEDNRVAAWADGARSVMLIVRRQAGANILEVIDRVKALLPELAGSISPAIDVQVAVDRSQTIRASVHDVQVTLALSVVLVVLVVFAFLRSASATIVPSVAVPLALIGTFGVMYLCGYSLDNLSLMALTISTGFVVDDAIVVTENITRLIEGGEPPFSAALKGARQIGFTIISITVSLLAVFIPILLMGGIVGRLFREFAVTLSVAIVLSALIALTLTPMMASRMLRSQKDVAHGGAYRFSERIFDGMLRGYARGLRWVLRHHRLTLLLTVAAIAFTGVLYVAVPKTLFPRQDTGQIRGVSEAPQDISFLAMRERQQALNAAVLSHPAVEHMVSFIGGGFQGAQNNGNLFIQLKPLALRKQNADEVIADLRRRTAKVPGIVLFLQAAQDVRVGARSARTEFQYTLQDANLAELEEWAPRVLAALRKLPELRDVASDQQTDALQLSVEIDRDTSARLGIQPQDVDNALYDAYGQRQVATIFTQLNQYRVILEVKPEFQGDSLALERMYVKGAAGSLVPLAGIARTSVSGTSLSVSHQGQFPAVTISFNVAPRSSLGAAVTAIHGAERAIGLPPGVQADFQGTAQAFQQSLASAPFLVLAALIAVYIVLGVLYESTIHPITILSTLPSAGVGALLALLAWRTPFSIIALIGIILLMGIVKKNAILMIDFALELERREGLSARDAIFRSGILRFRPILMTTLAALLGGGLPLALSSGVGAELRRPLGIAIVGGLIMSQILTLFTTPVVYLALDRFSRRPRGLQESDSDGPPAETVAAGER